MTDRPRPPGPPRCPGCGYIGTHAADCLIGTANEAHWENVRAVQSTLERAISERRNDREFMARLRRNMEKHADLLDRLAGGESGSEQDPLDG